MMGETETMLKIFLAEDEIVMREGIRNNIAWQEEGFEFVDWYATPNFKFAYKFEPVHQNTSVYALFQSTR